MKLSTPKLITFWIAVAIALLGILGQFVITPLAPFAFWLVVVAFVVLMLGNLLEGV